MKLYYHPASTTCGPRARVNERKPVHEAIEGYGASLKGTGVQALAWQP